VDIYIYIYKMQFIHLPSYSYSFVLTELFGSRIQRINITTITACLVPPGKHWNSTLN